MPITCPACKALNEVPASCRRCKADLSMLWDLEGQRANHLALAWDLGAQGEVARALQEVKSALALRAGDDARRLLAVLHLLGGDFAAAWNSYPAAPTMTDG